MINLTKWFKNIRQATRVRDTFRTFSDKQLYTQLNSLIEKTIKKYYFKFEFIKF